MSELGESTELVNELILESVKEDNIETGHKAPKWHRQVALSTLLMALLTAVGALLAGITAHESILDRTEELMNVAIAENDRTNIEVLRAKIEILDRLGESPDLEDQATLFAYQNEIEHVEKKAVHEAIAVRESSYAHLVFAVAVTILSVGITMSGMAVIIDQKSLWVAGLVFGIVGAIGVTMGIYTMLF